MAIGKNKRLTKGKKGSKKKVVDPFTRKDWYDIKAPVMFRTRQAGKTLVNKTQGTKTSTAALKGRVFEVNLADLTGNEEHGYRKIKLRCEEVKENQCLTNFYGMDFTTDKLRGLVKKWHTLIEADTEVKTTDGYTVSLFCIGFTKRRNSQVKKTCYAQTSQIKRIRRKMVSIMQQHGKKSDLKTLVEELIPEVMGNEMAKAANGIFPIENVYIRKVKILKSPKFDMSKLMELHSESGASADVGKKL